MAKYDLRTRKYIVTEADDLMELHQRFCDDFNIAPEKASAAGKKMMKDPAYFFTFWADVVLRG